MRRWKVEWEMGDPRWCAAYEHVKDFSQLWNTLPWLPRPISRETDDEQDAREQFEALRDWEATKAQPVRNVRLYKSDTTP